MNAVVAARQLADELLRPTAERVDVEGVPRSHLQALAAAGLLGVTAPVDLGGRGESPTVRRQVAELLAGASASTWFVWTQHAMPQAVLLDSANEPLRERHLRSLCDGSALAGVAVAHLRREGEPAVRATRTGGGWRLDGTVGWMTSWGLCDVLLLGARSDDDEVVLALLPAQEQPGLTATPPLQLAAMSGTATVQLQLDGLVVADADVADVTPAATWLEADRVKTADVGPHVFGLQRECTSRLAALAEQREDPTAGELARSLADEGERLRAVAYALLDHVPPGEQVEERLEVRAAALELCLRSAAALVTATGGSGMSLDAAPQRLAREALFFLVQAQTAPVREATLRLLLEQGP